MTAPSSLAWFHCFTGVTGEMALGALVDAGADLDEVRALCDRLPLSGWELEAHPVRRSGLPSLRVHVACEETSVIRTGAHIAAMVDEARLPDRVRRRAQIVFDLLVAADGRVHRRPADQAHFHEMSDTSAIIEIVGTCAALEVLDIDDVVVSPVALGRGMVRAGLGMVPVPTPMTLELLRDVPTYGIEVSMELTTPTGAALVAGLASSFGPMPSMIIRASGFGAGPAEVDGRPRVAQVVTGAAVAELTPGRPLTLLEVNLDDATGETIAHTVGAVLDAGADDAWVTPILRGRGRPAHTLSVLVDSSLAGQVASVLTAETGSFAIRGQRLEQWPVAHEIDEVDIDGRRIRVEVSRGRVKVTHDDAARAARHIGIPVREVVSLAEEAWRRSTRGELTEIVSLDPGDRGPDDEPPSIVPGPGEPGSDDIA